MSLESVIKRSSVESSTAEAAYCAFRMDLSNCGSTSWDIILVFFVVDDNGKHIWFIFIYLYFCSCKVSAPLSTSQSNITKLFFMLVFINMVLSSEQMCQNLADRSHWAFISFIFCQFTFHWLCFLTSFVVCVIVLLHMAAFDIHPAFRWQTGFELQED